MFTRITEDAFKEMQFNAGVLAWSFDPSAPALQDSDIVCATSGGFTLNITPNIIDTGEKVFMMPPNTAEMMAVKGWSVEVEFSSIGFSADLMTVILGAADNGNSILPRSELQDTDFHDLWWLGDRVDGGMVAVRLIDALSDDGLSFASGKNAMGGMDVHMTAHTSIEDEQIPVEIYSVVAHPSFNIEGYRFLMAYNMDGDVASIDEETGVLTIEQNGSWTYSLDTSTGQMEVSN